MKKRTWEEQEAELKHLQQESLRITKVLAQAAYGSEALFKAQADARKLTPIITRRERTDRCYYCGATKRELRVGTNELEVTQCKQCWLDEQMEAYTSANNEYYRQYEMRR